MASKKFELFYSKSAIGLSEIFNIFRITVLFIFLILFLILFLFLYLILFLFYFIFISLLIQENFRKKLKTIVISKPLDDRSNLKKTIAFGCLHYDIKHKFFTLLFCDLEI